MTSLIRRILCWFDNEKYRSPTDEEIKTLVTETVILIRLLGIDPVIFTLSQFKDRPSLKLSTITKVQCGIERRDQLMRYIAINRYIQPVRLTDLLKDAEFNKKYCYWLVYGHTDNSPQ